MRGLWKLVWVELKIFVREPLGLLATIGVPLFAFVVFGRSLRKGMDRSADIASFLQTGLPVLACMLMIFSAATSLIAIISIYRESGILKRLKATPLRPQTILSAHVVLKLILTTFTLTLLVLAGKRFYPIPMDLSRGPSIAAALLLSTVSLLSIGFVIASAVPTARFAQPVGSIVLYPLLAISGLLAPINKFPAIWQNVSMISPVTHAVTLLDAAWKGLPWWSANLGSTGALVANLLICTALSAKIFRWE